MPLKDRLLLALAISFGLCASILCIIAMGFTFVISAVIIMSIPAYIWCILAGIFTLSIAITFADP